jgi:ADP-ribosylglycohydrolase
MTPAPSIRDRIHGSLLGGAIGDALGAPIEFLSLAEIRSRFGPGGLGGYAGDEGLVTDDTQMTLFTAEGLVRAHNARTAGARPSPVESLHRAYLRWDHTQRTVWPGTAPPRSDTSGWLLRQPFLHHPRAPGRTCLSALRADRRGTVADRLNHSKGCGGIMRVAPIGFGVAPGDPFDLAVEAAALTHGHPSGYLAAGACALLIALLLRGTDLRDGAAQVLARLQAHAGHEETAAALRQALHIAGSAAPSPEVVESLGSGAVAEETLAIAVYCALVAPDFRSGVLLAVNHGGDSDSTGAVAGNLLGARHGSAALPAEWVERLEGRAVLEQVAADLLALRERPDAPLDPDRYPAD